MPSNHTLNAPATPFGSSLQTLGVVPLILFGCLWAGFGIFSFFLIQHWGNEYDRKMALIAGGNATPYALYVVSIRGDKNNPPWNIGLSLRRKGKRTPMIEDYEQTQALGDLAVGQKITAYKFDNQWFIPRFNTGGFNWGKWLFLGFGLAPPLIGAAIAFFVTRRRRARSSAQDAARTASPESALPLPFTRGHVHFDQPPTDDQLLVLLGSSNYTTLLNFKETPATLSARPGLLPMRYIVPWMLFIAGVITVMVLTFGIHGPGVAIAYGAVAGMWLVVLPLMFVIFAALNRLFAAQKDYFRIDLQARTLALPREDVIFAAGRIESIIVVERWYKLMKVENGWTYICQMGALVRAVEGFDYYPILQDRSKRPFQKPFGARIAEALNRPIRAIQRTRGESRELSDAP